MNSDKQTERWREERGSRRNGDGTFVTRRATRRKEVFPLLSVNEILVTIVSGTTFYSFFSLQLLSQ